MGMFSGGISWAGLILPYMENQRFYRRLRIDMPYDAVPNNDIRHLKGLGGAPQSYLYCASRRKGPNLTDGYAASDYAVPSVGADKTLDDPKLDDTWMQCHSLEKSHGPALLVHQNQPEKWKAGDSLNEARNYRSQTSFSSFVDGLSYQVFMGEKALHPDSLGKAGQGGDFTCYSFVEKSFDASGAARPGNGGISPTPDANKETIYRYWGSWHPDICHFAMGDARITKLSVKSSAKLLASLCDRRDASKITYPKDPQALLDDNALEDTGN